MNLRTILLTVFLLPVSLAATAADKPSRAADKDCKWEKFHDATVGLDAWVERCDYGFRKIDFLAQGRSLAIRYSDGGEPEALIDVIDLQGEETAQAGITRFFKAHTDQDVAARCVFAPYKSTDGEAAPAGVQRYTFVPDAKYQKQLDRENTGDEVPDPPCGDFGDAPDGIQYFESRPAAGAHKVLFVRIGQDTPLFDENTLTPIGK